MISISIAGTPLAIPADTSITMEQTAAWADIDNMSADIVWTFDLPAEPNEAVLGQANYTVVSQRRRYDCAVLWEGTPIADGQLYVQQADDERRLSVGITLNAFGPGWGSRPLSNDDYGDDITIATSYATHQQQWVQFLTDTLAPDSLVKFFLFYSENFARDNDDFGYHLGHLAHLANSGAQDYAALFVNRLFTDEYGDIIDLDDTLDDVPNLQGLQLFNTYSATAAKNGFVFAPAIRLYHIIQHVIASAGLSVQGSFLANGNVRNLFLQSLNTLDGDVFQYVTGSYIRLVQGLAPASEPASHPLAVPLSWGEDEYPSFSILSQSRYDTIRLSFQFAPDLSDLASDHPVSASFFEYYDDAIFLIFAPVGTSIPSSVYRIDNDHADARVCGDLVSTSDLLAQTGHTFNNPFFITVRYEASDARWILSAADNGINVSHDYPINSIISPNGMICVQLTSTPTLPTDYLDTLSQSVITGNIYLETLLDHGSTDTRWYPCLVRGRVYRSSTGNGPYPEIGRVTLQNAPLEWISDIEVLDASDIVPAANALNIFSNTLRWRDHVPDMTNSEFLRAICQFFGLTLWTGGVDRTVQLDFFADIFKAAALDISPYVVATRKTTFEDKAYDVTIASLKDFDNIADSNILPTVDEVSQLVKAQTRKGQHALVRNENAYRRSEKEDDSDRYSWQPAGGNDTAIHVGSADAEPEEVQSDIKVPNMKWCDQRSPKYLLQIDATGNSPLLDLSYSGKFEPILLQYRGRRRLVLQQTAADERPTFTSEACIEDANPTNFNADGSTDTSAISLTATGDRSVGEMWQRPRYQFLASSIECEFTLLLPVHMFLELHRLMQPQDGPMAKQTRWVAYKSQRYLPTKVSYEFGRGDTVKATITALRRVYEN